MFDSIKKKGFLIITLVMLALSSIIVSNVLSQNPSKNTDARYFQVEKSRLQEAFRLKEDGRNSDALTIYSTILETTDDDTHKIRAANEMAAIYESEQQPEISLQYYNRIRDLCRNLKNGESGSKDDPIYADRIKFANFWHAYSARRIFELRVYQTHDLVTIEARLEQARKYFEEVSDSFEYDKLKAAAANIANSTNFLEADYKGYRTEFSVALETYIDFLVQSGYFDEASNLIPMLAETTQDLQQELDLSINIIHRKYGSGLIGKSTALEQVQDLLTNRKHEKVNCASVYGSIIMWSILDKDPEQLLSLFDQMCASCAFEARTEDWFYQTFKTLYAVHAADDLLTKYELIIPTIVQKFKSEQVTK